MKKHTNTFVDSSNWGWKGLTTTNHNDNDAVYINAFTGVESLHTDNATIALHGSERYLQAIGLDTEGMVGTGLPLSSHELHLRTQGVTKLKVADNKTSFNGGYVVIDNAGTSTTSTVNGAVTSNTSVTLSAANSDITTGMEVTGTGINGSPTVSSISGTSLTLSSQQTLADAVVLTFTQPKATLGTESHPDLFTFSTTGDVTFKNSTHDFDIASHDGSNGLKLGGVQVTSTAAELNILDGSATSATSTTLQDADRLIVNDDGTMVQVALPDFEEYFEAALDSLPNVTTVGALNAGSITSGFGSIDNGSSSITTLGTGTIGNIIVGTGASGLAGIGNIKTNGNHALVLKTGSNPTGQISIAHSADGNITYPQTELVLLLFQTEHMILILHRMTEQTG